MEIYDLKTNGIRKPLGFELPFVRVSWKVRGTAGKRAENTSLTLAADAAFTDILIQKNGPELSALGEVLDITLLPRTRYFLHLFGTVGSLQLEAVLKTYLLRE